MLSPKFKASILAKAGMAVPAFPARGAADGFCRASHAEGCSSQADMASDAELAAAVEQWNRLIEARFVEYAAARAARSLRTAVEADWLERLRDANAGGARAVQRKSRSI